MKTKFLFLLPLIFMLVLKVQAQWTTQPTGLPGNYGLKSIVAVNSNVVWANTIAVPQVSPIVIRTADGGNSWISSSLVNYLPTGFFLGSVAAIDANTAWVSAGSSNANSQSRIYKTTDGGLTWQFQPSAFATGGEVRVLHFFDANNGVALGSKDMVSTSIFEIFTTSDGGTNWTKVSPANLPPSAGGLDVASSVYAVSGNTIWVGVDGFRAYKSTDRGLSWSVGSAAPNFRGGGDRRFLALSFSDNNNGLASDVENLYQTSDGGATWSKVNYSGPLHKSHIQAVPGSQGVYISAGDFYWPWHALDITDDRGSSFSFDNGNSWVSLGDTLAHTNLAFINSSTGWTSGMDGTVHKFSGAPLGRSEIMAAANPFTIYPNPSTGIFTISGSTNQLFRVEVYSITGTMIAQQQSRLFGSTRLDLTGQPKSIYLIKIYSQGKTYLQKIVLI